MLYNTSLKLPDEDPSSLLFLSDREQKAIFVDNDNITLEQVDTWKENDIDETIGGKT